jgi:NADH dehydrogenase
MARLYPDLVKYPNITVYDVAPKVLSMFDEKLSKYAMQAFQREGIQIKTSHHVEELRRGPPKSDIARGKVQDEKTGWTLKVKEDGEIGVGMVVWSTGLMMNPFVENQMGKVHNVPHTAVNYSNIDRRDAEEVDWRVAKDPKTGGLITDHHLRLILEPKGDKDKKPRAVMQVRRLYYRPSFTGLRSVMFGC